MQQLKLSLYPCFFQAGKFFLIHLLLLQSLPHLLRHQPDLIRVLKLPMQSLPLHEKRIKLPDGELTSSQFATAHVGVTSSPALLDLRANLTSPSESSDDVSSVSSTDTVESLSEATIGATSSRDTSLATDFQEIQGSDKSSSPVPQDRDDGRLGGAQADPRQTDKVGGNFKKFRFLFRFVFH